MKNYELLYIVSAQYTEKELADIRQKVEALITKNSGVINYTDLLGKRKLAYPINKALHGYYVVAEFEMEDGKNLFNIDKNLRLDKEILRAQIIIKQHKTNKEDLSKKQKREEAKAEKPHLKTEAQNIELDNTAKTVKTKDKMKNLDEKLEEILKDDTIL